MAAEHQLHVITDGVRDPESLVRVVDQIAGRGATFIQLRYKSAAARDVWQLAQTIQPIVRHRGVGLLINDRIDVALAVDAVGCHLAGRSLPASIVRSLMGTDRLIGVSVHAVDDAINAAAQGVDYVTFGHVFASTSKPGLAPRGLDQLRAVVDAVSIPVLAIGGITPQNINSVLATGCTGIAVIGAVMSQADPAAATYALREAMDASEHRPKVSLRKVITRNESEAQQ